MPEIKVPKEKKPKQKKEKPEVDTGEVVSAYSEEGQRRIKKTQDDKRKFIVFFILMTLVSVGMAIGVIILFNSIA